MALSRRDLLKLALIGAAHPVLPMRGIVSQAFAAPGAADAKFLLVFLRGGYDAANVVVPVGSDFYYEARPTIALPKPDPTNPNAAILKRKIAWRVGCRRRRALCRARTDRVFSIAWRPRSTLARPPWRSPMVYPWC